MKFSFLISIAFLMLSACASKQQVETALKENPDILYEAMKKDPEKFMTTLQEVARAAQMQHQQRLSGERKKQMEDNLKNPKAPQVDGSRVLFGPVNAPVTIVKYADFQCPACQMGFFSLEEIKKKYGDKVRIVHKNIPLRMHPQAQKAAEIFEALLIEDKSKARKFYSLAYSTQGEWDSEEALWKMLKKIGGDAKKVQAQIKKGEVEKRIQADLAEHEKFGFQGTPAYMINGVALYGAQSPDEMSLIIERFLKK